MTTQEINKKKTWFITNRLKPLAESYHLTLNELNRYVCPKFTSFWVNTYIEQGLSLGSKFAIAPWEITLENNLCLEKDKNGR